MNKMSAKETEITLDLVEGQMTLTTSFDNYKPLTIHDIDKVVHTARLAQAEVATQIFSAVVKAIGNALNAIRSGMRAARTYKELSRLSDRGLADIGLNREDIARMGYAGSESRSAVVEFKAYGYDMKAEHPSNDYGAKHVA